MATTLAWLHSIDWRAIGLERYGGRGDYCSRQVRRKGGRTDGRTEGDVCGQSKGGMEGGKEEGKGRGEGRRGEEREGRVKKAGGRKKRAQCS